MMRPIKAAFISIQGKKLTDKEKYLIEKENPLGVALFSRNISTPSMLKRLTQGIKEAAGRSDILVATDQEGGRVCRLQPPYFRNYLAQAAIGHLSSKAACVVAALQAYLISHDFHKVGINSNFAPTLDVATPKITPALKSRCFSRDEKIVANLGNAMFETYNACSILPCIKHLPGHSGAENDPHLRLSKVRKIYPRYLYPFEKIAPKALMAMTAHIVLQEFDALPITMSARAIQNLIRERFDFKGILVSDALEMRALPGNLTEKTIAARKAGCDAVCYCRGDTDGVQEVLNHCGYLSDTALAVQQKISSLIAKKFVPDNIVAKARDYYHLAQYAPTIKEDYDAVEVLNLLYAKK